MIGKDKKLNLKKFLSSQKFLSLVGLLVIILVSWPFVKNEIRRYRVNREIAGLKEEIAGLENKGVDLKNFVSYLSSDQFAEEQARLNLGLKKPGEELTILKNNLSAVTPLISTTSNNQIFSIPGYEKSQAAAPVSNFRKWLNYFF